MKSQGWIDWTPKIGRNQRSLLYKRASEQDVRQGIALEFIGKQEFESALEVLNQDQNVFGQLLARASGAGLVDGKLHVQLTYNRLFSTLLPHVSLRASERFLVRQLYACLVQSDRHGRVSPDIAHHWDSTKEGRVWSFHLRPKVKFHNGEPIDSRAIAELFNKLKSHPRYLSELRHLVDIEAEHPRIVRFYLSEPDLGFAAKLADLKYGIQPAEQVSIKQSSQVIGSGCFRLVEQSDKWLKLEAYDGFHGYRSLTDEFTVWLVEKERTSKTYGKKALIEAEHDQEDSNKRNFDIEDGCLLAMVNANASKILTMAERQGVLSRISGASLWQALIELDSTFGLHLAQNFFPFWKPTYLPHGEGTLPKKLSIAVYDHFGLKACANAINHVLSPLGVDVSTKIYSVAEFASLAENKAFPEHLVLSNLFLDDNASSSAFIKFRSYLPLRACLEDSVASWLDQNLDHIQREVEASDYLEYLEPIGGYLMHSLSAMPMFHHRQSLSFQGILQGVAMTQWGWPDVKQVWLEE
ncbi:putative transport protein [Vibrio ishigakensis]|nr:putative transport protein [Vibrio ishigakensis]